MIAVLVFICGTVLIGYVSTRWPWVAHHSRRLRITLCGILVFGLIVLEYSRYQSPLPRNCDRGTGDCVISDTDSSGRFRFGDVCAGVAGTFCYATTGN